MKYFFFGGGLLLMVLGAVELLRWLCFRLHSSGGALDGQLSCRPAMALVLFPPGAEDVENLVRAGAQRVEWMSLKPPCRFICLTGEDAESQEIGAGLAEQYRNLELCRPEELAELLSRTWGSPE